MGGLMRLLAGRCHALGVAALLLGLALPADAQISENRLTPLVRVVQKARPSVVNIHSEKTLTSPDNRFGTIETSRRVNGMGTGVVVDERGYIITNQHVIDGVEKIRVTLADGSVFAGKLISADRKNDLAIIKIDAGRSLPIIDIGTSSDLMAGESVAAVGNAFGYEHTVTDGIVSALHRTVQLSETQQYVDLIQTDADINPGNSGGPLLNIDGQMIGINVAVRAGAQGIGFAIPVDKALDVAAELLSAERIARVSHGVVPAPPEERGPLKGLVVGKTIAGSPAAEAGLQPGDVILAAGEMEIRRPLDLERALLDREPGEQIELTLKRDDETLQVELELVPSGGAHRRLTPDQQTWDLLGLAVKVAPGDLLTRYQTRYRGGLLVVDVRDDGPADRQGIRAGDILVGLHIWETISLDNVTHILARPELETLLPLKFYVVREGKTLYGYLPVRLD